MLDRMDWRYRRVCEIPTDIFEHLPYMHDLAVTMEAKVVVELGTRFGTSAVAWLHALELTDGHLWTVDLGPAPFAHDRMTHVRGDDLSADVLAKLPPVVDIVFVDTDHRYQLTAGEIEAYRPRVRPGGAMIFHDTSVESFPHHQSTEPPYPVRKAVDEWVSSEGLRITRRENNNGLTVVWL